MRKNTCNGLNWHDIVKRIFLLYNAKTNAELGNILGLSGESVRSWHAKSDKKVRYPTWKTLEKIVNDKGVSWEWLLTGKEIKEHRNTPSEETEGVAQMFDGQIGEAIKNASEVRALLDESQNRTLHGRQDAGKFLSLTESLLDALESYLSQKQS